MGNSKSRPLNLNIFAQVAAVKGELFATFKMVWEEEMTPTNDKYGSLASCRRNVEEGRRQRLQQAPPDGITKRQWEADNAHGPIYVLAQKCSDAWDNYQDEQERRTWLQKVVDDVFTVITEAASLASNVNEVPKVKSGNPENLNRDDRKAAQNIVNMFGIVGKHNETRAHQVPGSRACNIFWGTVCEALSGFGMSKFKEDKKLYVRTEMSRELARFQMNLFAFETVHNPYYDLLEGGQCVMIIPLLTLDEIANWKQGKGYEVLICCDSQKTHRSIAGGGWSPYNDEKTGERMRELKHMKWEDDGDLEKAREVLTAHIEALADSLNIHWTEYHDQVNSSHQEFASKKKNMTDAHDLLVGNRCQVGVPKATQNRGPFGRKFFKIDLGELYSGAFKKLIPDPGLFAFKAAVNWSGRTDGKRYRKLLSCCSPLEKSDEESYSSYLSGEDGHSVVSDVPAAVDLVGRAVWVVDSEDEHSVVSDVSAAVDDIGMGRGALVSDD